MAFDGVTIAAIVKELNDTCLGGRLYKIAQPESDELLLTIKTGTASGVCSSPRTPPCPWCI